MKSKILLLAALFAFFCVAFVTIDGNAQTRRTRTRKTRTTATPTPSPTLTSAEIISLADQSDIESNQTVSTENQTTNTQNTTNTTQTTTQNTTQDAATIVELNERITQLEAKQTKNADEKRKELLANLDLLTKAEMLAETLRRQLFDVMEKQTSIQTRLDQINYDLRPEMIERYAAFAGSLRPEEVREARQKTLESEKRNLESLQTQLAATRTTLEQKVQKADSMVERLRAKLEKEIDAALEEDK